MADYKLVGVNERGIPVGEDHWNAKLSRKDADLILELLEERDRLRAAGDPANHLSLAKLAEKFEVSKSAIRQIADGTIWAQVPAGYKRRYADPTAQRQYNRQWQAAARREQKQRKRDQADSVQTRPL